MLTSPVQKMILIAAAVVFGAAGCSTFQNHKDDSRLAEDRRGDTVAGFVGLPPSLEINFDEAAPAVATAYGGAGVTADCATLTNDIARLTTALGPDYDARAAEAEAAEKEKDKKLTERGKDVAEDAPVWAEDLLIDYAYGFNPARGVVRFATQAGEKERAYARRLSLLSKRRAYLRGVYDLSGCVPPEGENPPWDLAKPSAAEPVAETTEP